MKIVVAVFHFEGRSKKKRRKRRRKEKGRQEIFARGLQKSNLNKLI